VNAPEGQRFQEKIIAMQKKLSAIGQEQIKKGMKFFGEREKKREERLQKQARKRGEPSLSAKSRKATVKAG